MDSMGYRRKRGDDGQLSRARSSVTMGILRRQQGFRGVGCGTWSRWLPELVLNLVSPSALPCPEGSPAFNVQFSKHAGDGNFLAFGTEWGMLTIVDTRAEATVQRDQDGPVGPGALPPQPNHIRSSGNTIGNDIRAGRLSTIATPRRGTAAVSTSYGRRGVGQPAVLASWRVLNNCIFDLEWMQGDRVMALGCGDSRCRVQDVERQIEVCSFSGHLGSVKSVSANPIMQCVVLTGSRDGSFAMWDTRVLHRDGPNGQGHHGVSAVEHSLLEIEGPRQSPLTFPVEQVIEAHTQGDTSRKRPRSYKREQRQQGCSGAVEDSEKAGAKKGSRHQLWGSSNQTVTSVKWMADGEKFITGGQDGLVKLWDTRYARRPLVEIQPSPPSTNCEHSNKVSQPETTTLQSIPPFSRSACITLSVSAVGADAAYPGEKHAGSAVGRTWGAAPSVSISRGRGKKRGRGWGRGGADDEDEVGIRGGVVIAQEASESGRPYGVSSVDACDDGSRIAVCTVKNQISVYRYVAGTLVPFGRFTGNENGSSYYIRAKLSPDGCMLASGSPSDAVCLWEVDSPGAPVARLQGHVNEVTGIDWCRSETLKLASCSDDETVRLWTLDPGSRARSAHLTSPKCVRRPSNERTGVSRGETCIPRTYSGVGGLGRSDGGVGAGSDLENGGNDAASAVPKKKFGLGRAYLGENERWEARSRGRPLARVGRREGEIGIPTLVGSDAKSGGEYLEGGDEGQRARGGVGGVESEGGLSSMLSMDVDAPRSSVSTRASVIATGGLSSSAGCLHDSAAATPACLFSSISRVACRRCEEHAGIDRRSNGADARGVRADGHIVHTVSALQFQTAGRVQGSRLADESENADPRSVAVESGSLSPQQTQQQQHIGPAAEWLDLENPNRNPRCSHLNNDDVSSSKPPTDVLEEIFPKPHRTLPPPRLEDFSARSTALGISASQQGASDKHVVLGAVGGSGRGSGRGRQKFRGSGIGHSVGREGGGGCSHGGQKSLMAFWKRGQGGMVLEDDKSRGVVPPP